MRRIRPERNPAGRHRGVMHRADGNTSALGRFPAWQAIRDGSPCVPAMRIPICKFAAVVGFITATPASALDTESCRLELAGAPAAFAECGLLEVPLDPAEPDGAGFKLFVARIPAVSGSPRPDPLVLISGGPGQSTVDFYLQTRGAFEELRREREIILLDQRGTGRSADGLVCPTDGEDLALETAAPADLTAIAERCLGALEHDPRLFTTSVAVRDLERLREALAVPRFNLYGISYGSRVAQHYLRRYPQHTRALIIDGVVPAGVALGPEIAPLAQQALDAVFARCASSTECAARFGDLPARFGALRERLAADAVDVVVPDARTGASTELRVSMPHLQAVIRLMSYSAPTAALLPLVISEAHDGNLQPLAAQAGILIESLADSLSFAMHNAVICTEDIPFLAAQDEADVGDTYLGTTVIDGIRAVCEHWPAGVLDDDLRAPLRSDRPVLLLSGENDPITPPAYAERAIADGLSNAVHLIGRGQGHGLAPIGCVPRLMRRFLDNPEPDRLDAACLEREPVMPFFLDFNGPLP